MNDESSDHRRDPIRLGDPTGPGHGPERQGPGLDPDAGAAGMRESVRKLFDGRLGFLFLFGVASGYPWVLLGSGLTARLADAGLGRSALGALGVVATASAVSFLWAPFVDRLGIPDPGRRLGSRRAWILGTQLVLVAATVVLAFADPVADPSPFGATLVVVALASATHNLVVQAYRIEIIPRTDPAAISHGVAATTAGWWVGFASMDSLPRVLAGLPGWSWTAVYLVMAALWIPLVLAVLFAPRAPGRHRELAEAEARYGAALGTAGEPGHRQRVAAWLGATLVEPFREIVVRLGPKLLGGLLLFAVLFRIGETVLGRTSIVFYEEVGYSASQIATYAGLGGVGATLAFVLLATVLNARLGLVRGLFVAGVAMAGSNLMYSWIAVAGPVGWLFAATVLVEGFTAAFATLAFIAFVSYLPSHTYTATQYAFLLAILGLGGTVGGTGAASLADFLPDAPGGNWSLFFIITALMVIPGLMLLLYVRRQLRRKLTGWGNDAPPPAQEAT